MKTFYLENCWIKVIGTLPLGWIGRVGFCGSSLHDLWINILIRELSKLNIKMKVIKDPPESPPPLKKWYFYESLASKSKSFCNKKYLHNISVKQRTGGFYVDCAVL